ncbi:uncharacterized protein AMSG_04370 [Thecamonas trahens ATCC 50062]|uniref:Uncharacterized protein n=1 Tax=Thecamonas trahens ATCC 50062 TaxID=461836 RepID=A0A0L0D7V1_THETB|nr:hypothetical protein AMSG_04370 [Thecamonas trahens ATCC 50062]KNC48141.1 hypothetical protein AMSG_04370 [Thecamonas trahens ATCC 50062]|eukprot:XP_013758711.1 hypothetical protein AMSG_04370 [Thecamonas trahens ATCC 50062]
MADGAPPSAVGATRCVSYGSKAAGGQQQHALLALSEAKHLVRWKVVAADAAPELVGSVWGIALTRITENAATYIALSATLARPASEDVLAGLQASCQASLSDLRMFLQNKHELLRVRFRPYSRPHLLLQQVSDALLADAAHALAHNSIVSSITLARGSVSRHGVETLMELLASAAGLASSLTAITLTSLQLSPHLLSAFVSGLAHCPIALASFKILGSTLADDAALVALVPALEALADAMPSLVQLEVHVGDPRSALLPLSITNRVQRNRAAQLEHPDAVAGLEALDLVTNPEVDPELAARVARTLATAPKLKSLWIHDVGGAPQAVEALIRAGLGAPKLEAFRLSRTRRQPLTQPFLYPLVDAILSAPHPDALALRYLELSGLELSTIAEGDSSPLLASLLALIRANTPLQVLVAPQDGVVAESVLTALAAAVSDSNSSLLVLELGSPSSHAPVPTRIASVADGMAFGQPGLALLASALLANRDRAIKDIVAHLAANDPNTTILHSEILVDEHSLLHGGLADALRTNTVVETIRHFHTNDAAAVALGEALLDNPRSGVRLIQLDGALTHPTCAIFTQLVHARENLSVSLGPANPYNEQSRSFAHSPASV